MDRYRITPETNTLQETQTQPDPTTRQREYDTPLKQIVNPLTLVALVIVSPASIIVFLLRRMAYFWTQQHQSILFNARMFLIACYAIILLLSFVDVLKKTKQLRGNYRRLLAPILTAFLLLITVFGSTDPDVPEKDIVSLRALNSETVAPRLTVPEGAKLIAEGLRLSKSDDLTKAQGELGLERYSQAISLIDEGMKPLTLQLADAHFYKARALWASAGDHLDVYESALREANLSLSLRPRFSPALVIKCVCLRTLVTHPDNLEEARSACEEAIRADNTNPGAYNAMGDVMVVMDRFDDAIANFNEGIRLSPGIPLWSNRAVAIHRRAKSSTEMSAEKKNEEDKLALSDVNHALRIAPKFRDALLNRATIYKSLGDIQSALDTYEDIVKSDPNDAYAWSNLGDAIETRNNYSKKDLSEALFAFNQALRVNPEFEDALFNKGSVLNQLGRYEEAIEPLSHACMLNSTDDEALAQLAYSYAITGKKREALLVARKALKVNPKNLLATSVLHNQVHP